MVSRGRGRRRVGPEILCPTRFFRLILRVGGMRPRGSAAGKSTWGQGLAGEAPGEFKGGHRVAGGGGRGVGQGVWKEGRRWET